MPEVEHRAEAVAVSWACDCGGQMKATGIMLTVDPPLYPHKCTLCGAVENLDERYPTIRWLIDDEPDE